MEKYLYFRTQATIGDDDDSGQSACFPLSSFLGMHPTADDTLTLFFIPQIRVAGGVTDGQDFDQVPTADGFLDASNFQVTLPEGGVLTDFFKDGSDAFTTEVAEGANTVGADASVLVGWSWAGLSGNLAGF